MDANDTLKLPMPANDAGAKTVAAYFRELLHELWKEGEEFSGKRPFGNSGWEDDLRIALVKGGAVKGVIDAEDSLIEIDDFEADAVIHAAIDSLR
jgi:hypothetical protein